MYKPGPRSDFVPLSTPEGVSGGFSLLMGGTAEERTEAEANFRLAMAAPDLLYSLAPHLLEEIADAMEERGMDRSLLLRAMAAKQRTAIAKAIGHDGGDEA